MHRPAAMRPAKGDAPLNSWSIEQVASWLASLGLPAEVQESFRRNAVDGGDLIGLSDEDLVSELGCTALQARKIRHQLTQLGVAPPPASRAPSAAASATSDAPSAPPATVALGTPAAAAAAAAGEPDPRLAFQPADLQRYQQLKAKVAELQGLQPAAKVSQATSHLESVQRALVRAQQQLPPLQEALEVEHKHIQKYSGEKMSLTKVFTTKKHQETKLAEAQAQAESLSKQIAAAEAAVAAHQVELKEARLQLAAWQDKVSELSATQRELEQHVVGMFSAPAWRASARQCELSDRLKVLEGQAAEAARGVGTYGRGAQLLGESNQLLAEAVQGLQQTQMMTMMDMGMGIGRPGFGPGFGGGGLMFDFFEIQIIQRSNDAISVAANKAMEATSLLPGLPQIDTRVLEAAKMGIFQNILFGGLGSDMIEMMMIQRSMRDVQTMVQQVGEARTWAQSNLAVYQHKNSEAQAAVAAKRGELESFRNAALQAALA
ncbi:TKL kinase [Chlorella sorokiniana]|uniref:TKL kinase n=1 Tax=Chlorella sorokiniana TaxID=3076 RepID=A0A2P6TTS5_CHLSO|nr:TKL kinase [Chlorella sorokiniana]|eukprot:PRW57471.1 TKL kinase [Chlorella sorokiniana]